MIYFVLLRAVGWIENGEELTWIGGRSWRGDPFPLTIFAIKHCLVNGCPLTRPAGIPIPAAYRYRSHIVFPFIQECCTGCCVDDSTCPGFAYSDILGCMFSTKVDDPEERVEFVFGIQGKCCGKMKVICAIITQYLILQCNFSSAVTTRNIFFLTLRCFLMEKGGN